MESEVLERPDQGVIPEVLSPGSPAEVFTEILKDHEARLLRFCWSYAATKQDREDLFQEILINVWQSLPRFRGQSSMTTWLYRIAIRVSMRFSVRSQKMRRRSRPLPGLEVSFVADEDPARDLERREEILRLRSCIGGLSEVERLIVTLHLEELPHYEIAEIVGISPNLVAVKLKRTRSKLAKCIEAML